MASDGEVSRIDSDIKTLWNNTKDLESKLGSKIDNVEERVNSNNTDLQLLSKDVKVALGNMSEFMDLFKQHDVKEMEKYENIESSLQSLDKRVAAYASKTDSQAKDMDYLKAIADKAKVYMIRLTWTSTILATLMSTIYVVHPFVEEYIIAKAAKEGKLNTPKYTDAQKRVYYDEIVKSRLPKEMK